MHVLQGHGPCPIGHFCEPVLSSKWYHFLQQPQFLVIVPVHVWQLSTWGRLFSRRTINSGLDQIKMTVKTRAFHSFSKIESCHVPREMRLLRNSHPVSLSRDHQTAGFHNNHGCDADGSQCYWRPRENAMGEVTMSWCYTVWNSVSIFWIIDSLIAILWWMSNALKHWFWQFSLLFSLPS